MAKAQRSFSFAPVALAALPEMPATTRAPNENDLPFRREFFAKVPDTVTDKGQQVTLFVPKAFWATRDGVDFAKVDGAYQKQKLRDQFNKWRDETKVVTKERVRGPSKGKDKAGKPLPGPIVSEEESENKARGHYVFFAVERTGKEPAKVWSDMGIDPKDAEPGVQVIVYIPN